MFSTAPTLRLLLCCTLPWACVASPVAAHHASSCDNPFATAMQQADPATLRQVARDCHQPDRVELLHNRAHHQELLDELATLAKLIPHSRQPRPGHFDAQRIYVGLLEAFAAEAWARGDSGVIDQLNVQYEQANRWTEAQLRGYSVQAKRAGQK